MEKYQEQCEAAIKLDEERQNAISELNKLTERYEKMEKTWSSQEQIITETN